MIRKKKNPHKAVRQRWVATEDYRDGELEKVHYHQHPGIIEDFSRAFGFEPRAAKVDIRHAIVKGVAPPKFGVLIVDLAFLDLSFAIRIHHYFNNREEAEEDATRHETFWGRHHHRAWVIEVNRYGEPTAAEIKRLRPIIEQAKEEYEKAEVKREKARERRRRYEQRKRERQNGRKEVAA